MADKELYRRVREIFEYRDGDLYWKKKISDKVVVGRRTGAYKSKGYESVRFDKKLYLKHRIIFLYHHGFLPEFIDHVNGNRADNRIENLRRCSIYENSRNRGMSKNNTSGYKGVTWNKANRNWNAQIMANRKKRHLGSFASPEEAHEAYCRAADELHRDFANHG